MRFIVIILILPLATYSQTARKTEPNRVLSIDIAYILQLPGGHVAQRFGINNGIGGGFRFKTDRNFLWAADGRFIYGNKSKDLSVLEAISTAGGDLINANGQLVQPRLYERGQHYSLHVGKLIPRHKKDLNSGLLLMAGLGWLQHKQRIEVPGEGAPQLYPEYKRGYDNLHGGPALSQTIGWQLMEPRRQLVNFYVAVECVQAFTTNLRGYNYATRKSDTARKQDYFFGLKLCWMIPRYLGAASHEEEYFYR